MPLRVIIVDDETLAREELEYLLGRVGDVEIVGIGNNGIEAVDLIRTHQPDLVFLDVQMPGLDGFAVLKKLLAREHRDTKGRMPQVVFATAFDQYAVRAFEVNAVDYLLKPFDRARLQQTIDKVRARTQSEESGVAVPSTDARLDSLLKLLEQQAGSTSPMPSQKQQQTGKVVVRAQQRLLLIDQKEICFAATDDGSIRIVTQAIEGTSNCRTLEELMDQLDPEMFWRAHRSHVVNIEHIREVVPWFKSSYQLRMDDKKQTGLPVSRSQTKRLRELFNL
ncbi:LytR/AlgR family response regulator transcription factor [Terriglobus saanensis]|uniref:Two component transcriptional regulator, LytTR family n=1 Tax=Terriglobus saanensis (strain ATCC BAA-1853 / DSM 23119 / SP1PR4) TaxID=401053 RepID=E8UYT6_TERSS|nr:LytTR family DNA-binding domain-containing protein [Terriglobus saanensis]ADV84302.1 two component transcriptional regulator, LytTR family [Terriglobus saanensis SP1PR4]